MQEYPDAKIILTVRDPDSWWESAIHSVHNRGPGARSWGKLSRGVSLEFCLPWRVGLVDVMIVVDRLLMLSMNFVARLTDGTQRKP